MEAYLQTEDLAVGYQGRTLIGEISLAVQRGRIVTLIGPNGSGKSTILKTCLLYTSEHGRQMARQTRQMG